MKRLMTYSGFFLLTSSLALTAFGQDSDSASRNRNRADRQRASEERSSQARSRGASETTKGQSERNRQSSNRSQAESRSRSERASASRTAQPRRGRITGDITLTKRVDVKGTDRQHLVAMLRTDQDNRIIVDLGSPGRLGDQLPGSGDRVTVFGRLARVGDRAVIIAEQFRHESRKGSEQQLVKTSHRPSASSGAATQPVSRSSRSGSGQARAGSQGEGSSSRAVAGIALAYDPDQNRLLIGQVMRGGPAEKAGLQSGDVLLLVDDQAVRTPREMFQAFARMVPGQQVAFTISRNGQRRTSTATLSDRSEQSSQNQTSRERSPRGQDDESSRESRESGSNRRSNAGNRSQN